MNIGTEHVHSVISLYCRASVRVNRKSRKMLRNQKKIFFIQYHRNIEIEMSSSLL